MRERDSRCSFELSQPCRCAPDSPAVGTPSYATSRTHPDAGDLDAIRIVTSWLRANDGPFGHLRFADGEFWTIMKIKGQNGDGLRFDGHTFGDELAHLLLSVSAGAWGARLLVGGDWAVPSHEEWIRRHGLMESVPWCPSSIWVNATTCGLLAEFFETLLSDPRPRILVANSRVKDVAKYLGARFIEVPASDAWSAVPGVTGQLAAASKDAVVLYCAGMASEILAWRASRIRPDLSHLDMGHIFDGAFGIRNRCWLLPEGPCVKRDVYFDRYAPVFRGERASFGAF